MKLVRGQHNLHHATIPCVATIGNFDGVHRGHQILLSRLNDIAKSLRLPSTVIIFEPQPYEYLYKDKAPARLMNLREKLKLLKNLAIDQVVCLYFNDKMANLAATDFIEEFFLAKLKVRYLLIGNDFRFGKNREGDSKLLQQYGFTVDIIENYCNDKERISSSRIRNLLAASDFVAAKVLLGRPYSISGRIVHGDKRGATLGIPTANVALRRLKSVVNGVYLVKVYGVALKPQFGVANVGTRPTIDGSYALLEFHLLNFNQDIYGKLVEVEFISKLRDEKRFTSLELLVEQIKEDIKKAKRLLNKMEGQNENCHLECQLY